MTHAELVTQFEELQEACFAAIKQEFQTLPEFKGKVTSVCYCTPYVFEDLELLHTKRHFNADVSYMKIRPEGTIPLGLCLYIECLPVAFAIGDISLERKAFEIHLTETSNFFGNSGLVSWIQPMVEILCALKVIIEENTEHKIEKVAIVNPVELTIEPLKTIGFEYTREYNKADQASVLHIKNSDRRI